MEIIKLDKISKKYGEREVLKDFSAKIESGEMVGIIGGSGSGKSTILNIIGLLEEYDSGELNIDGVKNIKINSKTAQKMLRETIGYLFQNFALVETENVYKNLELVLNYRGNNKNTKKEKIKVALEKVGLGGYENKKIFELSGGEQQRVALARLMLKECKIILADEPTGSLDRKNQELVMELLEDLNKNGKTIIIVTHDERVSSKCNRIIEL
ncbi:MAG: putative bacteriocin export ABC transporter [Clostridium sp.]|uniref:putative bacteriocin export ABC transporter n=1 Tax=Clostridium sp. TaxID=1506 RepID=UPI003F303BAD